MSRTVFGCTLGLTIGLLAACGGETNPVVPNEELPIQSIALAQGSLTVGLNGSARVDAIVRDAHGGYITDGSGISWSSNNTSIASVDGDGTIRGHMLGGPVSITASRDDKSATLTVMVTPDRVIVTPENPELEAGVAFQFTATAYDANGVEISADAPGWTVTFEATPAIGTITQNGVFTATRSGPARISATISGQRGDLDTGVPGVYDGNWMVDGTSGITFKVRFAVATEFSFPGGQVTPACIVNPMLISSRGFIETDEFLVNAGPAQSITGTFENEDTVAGVMTVQRTISGTNCGTSFALPFSYTASRQ